MKTELMDKWVQSSALLGALVWVILAGLTGSGRAPFGAIELLFLFAPLVLVPLGLALGNIVSPLHRRPMTAVVVIQPLAAGLTVLSFCISPGRLAALLVVAWFAWCAALGLAGFLAIFHRESRSPASWAVNIGRVDLIIAGAWLVASRLGLRPLGIQEPIVLLTAVHFHYTGFATALIAGSLSLTAQKSTYPRTLLNMVLVLVLATPFVIAAGFVWSLTLKVAAVLLLSTSLIVVAGFQLWLAQDLDCCSTQLFLRLSSLAVLGGMALACVYALGELLKQDWLLVPRMAATHGFLNGIGFSLFGLLGWLVWFSKDSPQTKNEAGKLPASAFSRS